MSQIMKFSDGSFVAHKVSLGGRKSRFSIWYSPLGFLRDAARIDRRGRSYDVPRDSMVWGMLQSRAEQLTAIREGF